MSFSLFKRPIADYFIAIFLMMAPIGNLLISFAGSRVSNWYELSVLIPFIKSVPAFEWLWLGLLFLSGLLFFFSNRLSRLIALISLFLVLFLNVYRLYVADTNSLDLFFLKIFSILGLLSTLVAIFLVLYFSQPSTYLRDLSLRIKFFKK